MQTEETLKPQLQQNIELLKERFGNSIDLYTKPVRILGIGSAAHAAHRRHHSDSD